VWWLPWQDVVRTFCEDIEKNMEIPIYDVPAKLEASYPKPKLSTYQSGCGDSVSEMNKDLKTHIHTG